MLLQKSTNKRYPPSSDDTALANSFADFFTSKTDKIYHGLVERKIRPGSSPPDVTVCGSEFCNFAEVTPEEIKTFSRKGAIPLLSSPWRRRVMACFLFWTPSCSTNIHMLRLKYTLNPQIQASYYSRNI